MNIIRFIIEEVRMHRLMGYTLEYTESAKKYGGVQHQITADEHTMMSEMDFSEHYANKDTLIRWYFSYLSNILKSPVLSTIGSVVVSNGYKNVLSVGCGPGVLEYILEKMLPVNCKVKAVDYDEYLIGKAKELIGESVEYDTYDFYKDSIEELVLKNQTEIVVLIGSSCSMDNKTYAEWLKKVYNSGVKCVIDFAAGVDNINMFLEDIRHVLIGINRFLKKIGHEPVVAGHAYRRYPWEIIGIMKQSGYRIRKMDVKPYKYTYCLYRQ